MKAIINGREISIHRFDLNQDGYESKFYGLFQIVLEQHCLIEDDWVIIDTDDTKYMIEWFDQSKRNPGEQHLKNIDIITNDTIYKFNECYRQDMFTKNCFTEDNLHNDIREELLFFNIRYRNYIRTDIPDDDSQFEDDFEE